MTDFAIAAAPSPVTAPRLRALQLALLWLVGASGAIVFIEPSPYEFAILLSIVLFLASGLRITPALIMPIALLIGVELGYSIGASDAARRPDHPELAADVVVHGDHRDVLRAGLPAGHRRADRSARQRLSGRRH